MHLVGAYPCRGTWRKKVVRFSMPKSNKHTLTFETKNELSTSSLCPIPLKHTFSWSAPLTLHCYYVTFKKRMKFHPDLTRSRFLWQNDWEKSENRITHSIHARPTRIVARSIECITAHNTVPNDSSRKSIPDKSTCPARTITRHWFTIERKLT